QRWPSKGLRQSLILQLCCMLGLMPLSLYWFSYGSINGFIANLFAIPLVGFLIVPLSLMTMLLVNCSWSFILIKPLSWMISLLFQGLIWTEHLAWINITHALPSIEYALCLMGALLLGLVLPIRPFKGIALIWILLPFIPVGPFIHKGEALIQVLDVGQGLAVSVRTAHHVLLYDTGDHFFNGNDLGNLVVLPFYKVLGIKKIDTIIISHPDKDHIGGLKSIQAGIQVDKVILNNQGAVCHDHADWEWDGVKFHFFPIRKAFKDKNNTSCVLQVSTLKGQVLFTGDIEAIAEDYLIQTYGRQLASKVLIVPHHGSKTSSSYRFLMEVSPQFAIASLGFDNRFGFPHAKTINNMQALGIDLYRTDACGMVEFLLPAKGRIKKPSCVTRTTPNWLE
ncbi:MAG: DNA internalization-related competence protein ComEC/Rec2, partial [Legionella sp.]|nr:DNA internalization-related competence protein ComEC/Rec2 [Legionella sp.]